MKNLTILFLMLSTIYAQNHVLYLDGDGDYVVLPETIIHSQTFTIETWFKMLGTGGGYEQQNTLYAQRDYATGENNSAIVFNAEVGTGEQFSRLNIRSSQGSSDIVQCSSPNYLAWHHLAGVVNPDSVHLYLDGSLVDVVENTQEGAYDQSIDQNEIGRHFHSTFYDAGYFNGYIDNMHLWDSALSPEEVNLAKNGNLALIQSVMLAGWDFENDLIDMTQNGNDGIAQGDAEIVLVDPFTRDFGLSLTLDGIDDYLSLYEPIIHNVEYTVEAWAAMRGIGGGTDQQNIIFSQRDYDTGSDHCAIMLNAENTMSGNITRWNIRSSNGDSDYIDTPTPPYGEWHHYTGVVRSDSIFLYLDGQLMSGNQNTQQGVYDFSVELMDIGRHYHASFYYAGFFNGYIDEIKVWSTARTPAEIQADMNEIGMEIENQDLSAYFTFDAGLVQDLSLNNHDGLLMGGATIEAPDLDAYSPCQLVGDLNNSDAINITDLLIMVQYVLDQQTMEINPNCADLSGDGVVNISDINLLILLLLGR